jgi:hypothetical protein
MKAAAVALLAMMAAPAVASITEPQYASLFASWKAQHGRSYPTEEE